MHLWSNYALRGVAPLCAVASFCLALSIASPLTAQAARPLTLGPSYPAEATYSLALHMHGSMSEQFGSWEWHAWKAESLGVDVVWWTDHDWRLTNWRHTNRYNFESAIWDVAGIRWSEADDAYTGESRYWEADGLNLFLLSAICDTLASEGTKSLRLWTNATVVGPNFEMGHLEHAASAVQDKYSLAKRVHLAFSVFPEDLDPADTRFVLEVEMSDHPEGTHVLRYVVGSMAGEGIHSIPLAYTPGVWNSYNVDVTADAIQHFTSGGADSVRGEDNSLALVKIGLETRNATNATVLFDDYQILPDASLVGDALMDRGRAASAHYEVMYPSVKQFHGSEISKFKARPHLNAYSPNHLVVDYTGYGWADSLYYAIDQVHAQGGAVSLNHTFGPGYDYQFNPLETPWAQGERLREMKRGLVGNRAMGMDILEVGYRRRGGMDLVHHLDLWDTLLGNAVWITGNGVTDSHGRGSWFMEGWGPSEAGLSTINNFITWLHTEEFSETGFVRAMKSGRSFFGDPYRWKGTLDMKTLDGFRMGQVVFTDRDTHDLVVEVTNVPVDVQVRLLQGEIRENPVTNYDDVNFLRDEVLTGAVTSGVFTDTISVDTTLPSFVRIEVANALGGELVYGNPIHFVRSMPAAGIPAEKIGVRIGDIRVFLADRFLLTGASLNSGVLTLAGDEDQAGTGSIRLDPGILGPPLEVTGVDAWSYLGGVVTLMGFTGTGSAPVLYWTSPTAAPPAPAARGSLHLGSPRPNPFDAGTSIDYVLPREGWVRLEILDVTGRRIRVLTVGFEGAGSHRAAWDGRDEGGMAVASGIYYVRLEHDGELRQRKLARLR